MVFLTEYSFEQIVDMLIKYTHHPQLHNKILIVSNVDEDGYLKFETNVFTDKIPSREDLLQLMKERGRFSCIASTDRANRHRVDLASEGTLLSLTSFDFIGQEHIIQVWRDIQPTRNSL